MTLGQAVDRVTRNLGQHKTVSGLCYVTSNALFHLLGGQRSGYRVMVVGLASPPHQFTTHYWLEGPRREIVDLTAGQFSRHLLPPYHLGRPSRATLLDVSTWEQELMQP